MITWGKIMQINIFPPPNTDTTSAECQNMLDLLGLNISDYLDNYPEMPITPLLMRNLEQHLYDVGLGKYKFNPSRDSLELGWLDLEVLEWNVPIKLSNISVDCYVVGDYYD